MSKDLHNPNAFPSVDAQGFNSIGMSLRDYFAAHALPACVMAYVNSPRIADTYLTPETLAEMTYNTADEMLKRRDK